MDGEHDAAFELYPMGLMRNSVKETQPEPAEFAKTSRMLDVDISYRVEKSFIGCRGILRPRCYLRGTIFDVVSFESLDSRLSCDIVVTYFGSLCQQSQTLSEIPAPWQAMQLSRERSAFIEVGLWLGLSRSTHEGNHVVLLHYTAA